jgi:hypothetical protein
MSSESRLVISTQWLRPINVYLGQGPNDYDDPRGWT